jgi:hypothetical protein
MWHSADKVTTHSNIQKSLEFKVEFAQYVLYNTVDGHVVSMTCFSMDMSVKSDHIRQIF